MQQHEFFTRYVNKHMLTGNIIANKKFNHGTGRQWDKKITEILEKPESK